MKQRKYLLKIITFVLLMVVFIINGCRKPKDDNNDPVAEYGVRTTVFKINK